MTDDNGSVPDVTFDHGLHVREAGHDGGPDTCRVHGLAWSECSPSAEGEAS